MLLSTSLKYLFLSVATFVTLSRVAVARPTLAPPVDLLVDREGSYEGTLSTRDLVDIDARGYFSSEYTDLERRGRHVKAKARQKKAKAEKRKANAEHPPPQHMANRITLGDKARAQLDRQGLHGKARRNSIKWHVKQVKKHMGTNPTLKGKAVKGVIEGVAHKGGSHRYEKNHITASFRDHKGKPIQNTFNSGNHHHIYVNNKGLNRHAKAASAQNNAGIKGKSERHTAGPKSKGKGKGKRRSPHTASKDHRDFHGKPRK